MNHKSERTNDGNMAAALEATWPFNYRKSSNKSRGGLLNFGPSGGGWGWGVVLIREGEAYLKFFNKKDRITLCLWILKCYAALTGVHY